MATGPSNKWAVLLHLAGLGAVATAVFLAVGEVRYARDGVTTTGVVVAVEREAAGFDEHLATGTTPRYAYRLRYRYDARGMSHVGEQSGSRGGYRVGQPIEVEYLETKPGRSRLAGRELQVWLTAAVFLLLGVGIVWITAADNRSRHRAA